MSCNHLEEAPPGFEPGMADLQSSPASQETAEKTRNAASLPAVLLESCSGVPRKQDMDLHRILDAWPTLPPAIRRAILALIESGQE